MNIEVLQGMRHALSLFEGSLLDKTGMAIIVQNLEQNIAAEAYPELYGQGVQLVINVAKGQLG